jgi:NDP-sugar pyrophosphorylase family protein
MGEVAGKPFLEWVILFARGQGIADFVLCTGYLADLVESHFGNGSEWGVRIAYSRENTQLGTAGALRLGIDKANGESFVVLNGDSYCRYDLRRLESELRVRTAEIVMWLVAPKGDGRYGGVSIDKNGQVTAFHEKSARGDACWINAGVYVIRRRVLEALDPGAAISLETQVFPSYVEKGLFGVCDDVPFIDIGTPESYSEASAFMRDELPLPGSQNR